jgi:hypothetical protein
MPRGRSPWSVPVRIYSLSPPRPSLLFFFSCFLSWPPFRLLVPALLRPPPGGSFPYDTRYDVIYRARILIYPFPLPLHPHLHNRYANTYKASLALLASGKLDGIEKMITHRFPLTDSLRAFDLMKAGTDEHGGLVVKVCVVGEPA